MIPKPLNEITWSDIEALRDSGRVEDDMIEYKSSFSGGSDFLDFNESQRIKAVDGIAREAIAFLNGRGGDVVIGVKEVANDHPKIEAITPIANVDATADRLGQALAALIEPTQSVLGVRAVRQSKDATEGVIIVRAPSSLRAPHRSTRSKECYVRRGRQSVAMPMDEVQDLTLNRATKRSERLELIADRFVDLNLARVRRAELPQDRFRIKAVFRPWVDGEIDLNQHTLSAFRNGKPKLTLNDNNFDYLQILERLDGFGSPMLRGRLFEGASDRGARKTYCAASIGRDLGMEWEYVASGRFDQNADTKIGIYEAWIIGFFAQAICSLKSVITIHNAFMQGILRVEIFVSGEQKTITGNHMWPEAGRLPEGRTKIPDFEIFQISDLNIIFEQLQADLYAIAGIESNTKIKCEELQ